MRSSLAVAADLLDPQDGSDFELAIECSKNLMTFVREAWPILEPKTPFVSAYLLDVIADHLQAVSSGDLQHLLINIPPRMAKSLMGNVFWPSWEWLTQPSQRYLCATYARDLTMRDSVRMRRLLEHPGGADEGTIFQRLGYQGVLRLIPGATQWELTGDQNVKGRYDNTATGYRLATSVGAQATGEGGDRIVIDDPTSADEATSDTKRKSANDWYDGTMSTRGNDPRTAAYVVIMQRLHEQDLTGHLLEQGDWHHLCLPAEYDPQHTFVYPAKVKLDSGLTLLGDKRKKPGELLEPVRLSATYLAKQKKVLGSYGYAGQMTQLPSPAEGGMFKAEWWKRYTDVPPQWQQVVQSWDMRFGDSKKASSSFVVGQVWGINGPQRYLLAQIRARLSFTETVQAVRDMTATYSASSVKLIEEKANGAAVMDTLKREIGGIVALNPSGGKDVRAAAASPYVEAGDIFLPAADFIPAPMGYEPTATQDFIGEHSSFPNGAHDDQVDAFDQMVNWLAEGASGSVVVQDVQRGGDEYIRQSGDLRLVGEQYRDLDEGDTWA